MEDGFRQYLEPTEIIDSRHPAVAAYAAEAAETATDPAELAVRLYLAVRDDIRYDPYAPFYLPEHYRASYVIGRGRSFCIPKASLLCALGRACSIPSRVGFATVRNHLATRQLLEWLGSDLFVYHGFVEFYLGGKWVKCTPAFNRELCERHRVPVMEFNGRDDSLFQPYNLENCKYMEYVEDLGTYADIPFPAIMEAWKKHYGKEFFRKSMQMFVERGDASLSDFENEEVWSG
jgi:transglutaminase-like putative cysteine protease